MRVEDNWLDFNQINCWRGGTLWILRMLNSHIILTEMQKQFLLITNGNFSVFMLKLPASFISIIGNRWLNIASIFSQNDR